jgi:hypothetical protein
METRMPNVVLTRDGGTIAGTPQSVLAISPGLSNMGSWRLTQSISGARIQSPANPC